MSQLRMVASKEQITAAHFTAIGACSRIMLSRYNHVTKQYDDVTLQDDLEVTGIIGNIGVMGGEVALHAHGTVGDAELRAHAGHIKELVVSATCEVFITLLPGPITRSFDDVTGLNLLDGK